MTRKSHKNNRTRLTARERARAVAVEIWGQSEVRVGMCAVDIAIIQRAIQAHARQALARERARRGGAR